MQEPYIHDYAVQLVDVWVAVPLLVGLGFGLWKPAKLLWATFSN